MNLRVLAWSVLGLAAWRGANAAFVLAVDRTQTSAVTRLFAPDAARRAHTLVTEEAGATTERYLQQYELLDAHVGIADRAYYLHEFSGDYTVIRQFQRIRWLLYPRYLQPVRRLPLPAPRPGALRDGHTLLLDCRHEPGPPPAGAVRVAASADGAVLWRIED